MENKSVFSLILWYIPIALVQFISAKFSIAAIGPWYDNLIIAPWNPPSWIFGPVWATLYILMTFAVWLVYSSDAPSRQVKTAYLLFFIQLALNPLWSYLFFGLQQPGLALIELGVLVFFATLTAIAFFRIQAMAGLLLAPYVIWLIFAFSLNATIWWLN